MISSISLITLLVLYGCDVVLGGGGRGSSIEHSNGDHNKYEIVLAEKIVTPEIELMEKNDMNQLSSHSIPSIIIPMEVLSKRGGLSFSKDDIIMEEKRGGGRVFSGDKRGLELAIPPLKRGGGRVFKRGGGRVFKRGGGRVFETIDD